VWTVAKLSACTPHTRECYAVLVLHSLSTLAYRTGKLLASSLASCFTLALYAKDLAADFLSSQVGSRYFIFSLNCRTVPILSEICGIWLVCVKGPLVGKPVTCRIILMQSQFIHCMSFSLARPFCRFVVASESVLFISEAINYTCTMCTVCETEYAFKLNLQ